MTERALYILILISSGGVIGILLWMFLREIQHFYRQKRFQKLQTGCASVLQKILDSPQDDVETLIDHYPSDVIELEMNKVYGAVRSNAPPEIRQRFLSLYQRFGIVDGYVHKLQNHRAWDVRAQAASALGFIGHPQGIEPLLKVVQNPAEDEQHVKRACLDALSDITDSQSLPTLIAAMGVESPYVGHIAKVIAGFGERAIPSLLSALKNGENNTLRRWSARVLGEIGTRQIVPQLIPSLQDNDEEVRREIAHSLGSLMDTRAVPVLIHALLDDPDELVRQNAALSLGKIADERALGPLVTKLKDADYWTRLRVIQALEMIGKPAVPVLELALRDRDREIQVVAAIALDRIGVVAEYVTLLTSPKMQVRDHAYQVLQTIGQAGAIEGLIAGLTTDHLIAKNKLIEILGLIGNRRAVPPLIEQLGDQRWSIRAHACQSLGRLRDPQAIVALVALLPTETEEEVKGYALLALNQFDSEFVEPHGKIILDFLKESNFVLRAEVTRLISRLSPKSYFLEPLRSLLSDPSATVRQHAVRGLAQYYTAEIGEALINDLGTRLHDDNRFVQEEAIDALVRIGGAAVVPSLAAALEFADEEQCERITTGLSNLGLDIHQYIDHLMGIQSPVGKIGVALILAKLQKEEALPFLIHFLNDADPGVRETACQAITTFGDRKSFTVILPLLKDPSAGVRMAAIDALGKFGDPHFEEMLLEALSDADLRVTQRVCIALALLGSDKSLTKLLQRGGNASLKPYVIIASAILGKGRNLTDIVQILKDEKALREIVQILEKEQLPLAQKFFDYLKLDYRLYLNNKEISRQAVRKDYQHILTHDNTVSTRVQALYALATLGEGEDLDFISRILQTDPDQEIRFRSAQILREKLHPASLTALVRAVKDPSRLVKLEVLKGLGSFMNPIANTVLLSELSSPDEKIREAAALSLAQINKTEIFELIDLMEGSQSEVRLGIISMIRHIHHPTTTQFLIQYLKDRDVTVRRHAATCLAQTKQIEGKQALIQLLSSPDPAARIDALDALSLYVERDVFSLFMRTAQDPVPQVRERVAYHLFTFSNVPDSELEILRTCSELSKDADESVQLQMWVSSLKAAYVSPIDKFKKAYPQFSTERAKHFRTLFQDQAGVMTIEQNLLRQREPAKRKLGLEVLAMIDAWEYRSVLQLGLEDPHPDIRLATAKLIGHLPDPIITRKVQELTRDSESQIRNYIDQVVKKRAS